MKRIAAAVLFTTALILPGIAQAGSTVDKIRARGELVCGVSQGSAGLSLPDSNGRWAGIDADYCRAVSSSVLGDANKVRFVPLSSAQRFAVLQNGEIDVLARNTTWTSTRDASLNLVFTGVIFYDGQGFMVPKKLGVSSARQLDGATVCVQPGTVNEQNLVDYFTAHKMAFKSVVIESLPELEAAFYAGRCDVYLSDASTLAASRASRATNVEDYVILPERITKSPLSPVVRADDHQWFEINRWVLNALIEAEELGLTSQNVEQERKNSKVPSVRRLLGVDPGIGKAFGLDEEWVARTIRQVGNYGEVFERNVGKSTKLGLERGQNALWSQGGLIYSPPFQ